jgi:protein SCO1/2
MNRIVCILALTCASLAPAVHADVQPPNIKTTRGTLVPNVNLVGEDSTVFHFAFLQGKPVIISPIFTSCPHTCSYITSSLRDALAEIGEPGVGYEVLTVSFDPADGPAELRAYREELDLPEGWRLAVADPDDLAALLGAIDFQYEAMDEGGFAHANAIAIVDPEMKVASYLHGVMFDPKELRAALERAVTGTSLVRKARPLLITISLLGLLTMIMVLVVTGRKQRAA